MRRRWLLLGVASCTLYGGSIVGRERTGNLAVDAGRRLRWVGVGQYGYAAVCTVLLGLTVLLALGDRSNAAVACFGVLTALVGFGPTAAELALRRRWGCTSGSGSARLDATNQPKEEAR